MERHRDQKARAGWLAISLVVGIGVSACEAGSPLHAACDPADPNACERHLQCRPGPYPGDPHTCQLAECYRNSECPGQVCMELRCVDWSRVLGVGLPCSGQEDCPAYLICEQGTPGASGVCRAPACYRSAECPGGTSCTDLRCQRGC